MAEKIEIVIEATDDASSVFGKVGSSLGGFAKTAAIGLGAAGVGLGALGLKAIGAASDVSESQNKVNVVFGESAGIINDFAQNAARNLGQSRGAALEMAGTFGNLFTSMGLGQGEAADLSTKIVGLGSDLASFNNIDPREALDKLRAGLVGEAEPLRALGVNLNAAQVEAKAMSMGLVDSSGKVTEAGKVQARYALILEQTKNAQGDFARTSTGMANSTRIIKASLSDMAATLGARLLPAIEPLVAGLALRLPGAIDFAAGAFDRIIGAVSRLTPIFQAIVGVVQQVSAAFQAGGLGAALQTLVAQLEPLGQQLLAWIVGMAPQIASAVTTWLGAFLDWIGPMIPPFLERLGELLAQLLAWAGGTALPALAAALVQWGGAFIDWIAPRIGPILEALGGLLASLLGWVVGTALPAIAAQLVAWGAAFVEWVAPQIGPLLGELGGLLAELGGWLIGTALPAIASHLLEWGLAFVKWVAPHIPPLLAELGSLLAQLGVWALTTALPEIVSHMLAWGKALFEWVGTVAIPGLIAALPGIASTLTGFFKDAITWLYQAGVDAVQGLINGIRSKAGEVAAAAADLGRAVLNALNPFGDSPWPGMAQHGRDAAQGFVDGILAMQGKAAQASRMLGMAALAGVGGGSGVTYGGPGSVTAGGYGREYLRYHGFQGEYGIEYVGRQGAQTINVNVSIDSHEVAAAVTTTVSETALAAPSLSGRRV